MNSYTSYPTGYSTSQYPQTYGMSSQVYSNGPSISRTANVLDQQWNSQYTQPMMSNGRPHASSRSSSSSSSSISSRSSSHRASPPSRGGKQYTLTLENASQNNVQGLSSYLISSGQHFKMRHSRSDAGTIYLQELSPEIVQSLISMLVKSGTKYKVELRG